MLRTCVILSLEKSPTCFPVSAATSYSHIAKGERQCVDRRVDLPEELLPVVLVHLLEVHACQNCEEDGGTESASETSCLGAVDFVGGRQGGVTHYPTGRVETRRHLGGRLPPTGVGERHQNKTCELREINKVSRVCMFGCNLVRR